MLKIKKILAFALSLIMAFGVFTLSASAADTVIDTAEISFDTNVAGVDVDDFKSDYESYIEILTEGLDFDDKYDGIGVAVLDSLAEGFGGYFEDGETYTVFVYLVATDGYELADEVDGIVNGKAAKCDRAHWEPNDDVVVEYATIKFNFTVGKEFGFGKVNSVDITIGTDIAGIYVNDYLTYIKLNSFGVAYENNNYADKVVVYDEHGERYYGNFESGETYYLNIFLVANEPNVLSYNMTATVNGETAESYVSNWYFAEGDGEVMVDYICIGYELTVDGEKELTFFEKIIEFFRNLFESILDFFSFGANK